MESKWCLAFMLCALLITCIWQITPKKSEFIEPQEDIETIVYRIDNFRYISIRGTSYCMGPVFYHDISPGRDIHTRVSNRTSAYLYEGYYASDSEDVMIPFVFHPLNGVRRILAHYSTDHGKTFKSFWAGGDEGTNKIAILKGSNIYTGQIMESGEIDGFKVDISQEITLSFEKLPQQKTLIEPTEIPFPTPLGTPGNYWTCNPEDVIQSRVNGTVI